MKTMTYKKILITSFIMVLITAACIKETYDMTKLSKDITFSPTMALAAIKGNISLSDMIKSNDTIVFDQNKLVKIIFKKDSVIDLTRADFLPVKKSALPDPGFGTENLAQLVAVFDPYTFDLDIDDILNNISGTISILNPIIRVKYKNPFVNPILVKINAIGKSKTKTVPLELAPFTLNHPATAADPSVSGIFVIDKTNSRLQGLVSILPSIIDFTGSATMSTTTGKSQNSELALPTDHLIGNLEIEVPLEFRMNNLQLTDTIKNFLKDSGGTNDSPVKPEDFQMLRIDLTARNGFPLGVSIKMKLYDSAAKKEKSTIDATNLLKPATVDSNGKVTAAIESVTRLEFTRDFFSNINASDKIIIQFTLNTTGNGASDIKIYSDYNIDFNATLVMKPEIKLN